MTARSNNVRATRRRITSCLALSFSLAVVSGAFDPADAQERDLVKGASGARSPEASLQHSEAPTTLSDVGIQLENAKQLAMAEEREALQRLDGVMRALWDDGIPAEKRGAAQLLWGEIHFGLQDYDDAARKFQAAEKSSARGELADDAALARIAALEGAGQDEEAAKAWGKWLKKHPKSPLVAEALLARTWNALRRVALEEAGQHLEQLYEQATWMINDPRAVLAKATLAMLEGRNADVLAVLGTMQEPAAALYLRALCTALEGNILKSAALYQQIVERHPDSPLRDHALLAKANTFLAGRSYKSAAEEFGRVVERAKLPEIQAEAELRHAASLFLDGDLQTSQTLLHDVVARHPGSNVAARGRFLLGEVLSQQELHAEAIVEYNRVLSEDFEHSLAATAQYRVGRCLDALGRQADATSTYQAVVSGYPLEPEAPAAAYLAGVGLLEQKRFLAAVPYFQIVLDRYAAREGERVVFESASHQELVEAALCMLELSYHRAGALGQLSGVPHLMLQQMPSSRSTWRAYALLIDADALASQARYPEAQASLELLIQEFPEHEVAVAANRLLAWTHARQGHDDLAIATEERMLARYAQSGKTHNLSSAYLNKAHVLFNKKSYAEAASAYETFLGRFPQDDQRALALYQAGLCYVRLGQNGDAVDRWESIVTESPAAEIAERAWARAADVYFQAADYDAAKKFYQGLLDHFGNGPAAARALLRLAQCDYNAGRDAEALQAYSDIALRSAGTDLEREANRGMEMALYRLGQKKGGMAVLRQLVDRYPSSAFAADAQFQIAQHLYEQEQYEEAAPEYRRVVTQFPGFSAADQAHYLMAESYVQMGATEEAQQAYEQFLMFFADSELRPSVQFKLGMAYFESQDYMRAALQFTNVQEEEASPEIAKAAFFNLALCQRMLDQPETARMTLEDYRKLHPEDERAAEVAQQLGEIHATAMRTTLAVDEFERALKANPSTSQKLELLYRLGVAQEQLGEVDQALGTYVKAVTSAAKEDAFRLSAVARCAALYETRGQYKKALAAYRDLSKNSKDAELVAVAKERAGQLQATVQ